MGRFGPASYPLVVPQPGQMPLPDATALRKQKHARAISSLRDTVAQVLNDQKANYATPAAQLVGTVAPLARQQLGLQPIDVTAMPDDEQGIYVTAAAYGMAAGQTEEAMDLVPGPEQVHSYMHTVLAMAGPEFNDVVGSYLVMAGHYLARRDGEGVQDLIDACGSVDRSSDDRGQIGTGRDKRGHLPRRR